MKNKPLIIGAMVIVVLAAAYFVFSRGGMGLTGELVKKEGESGGEFVGKLKEIVNRGIPMKCTFSNDFMSGTGYVKGKNYFAEVMTEQGQGYILMKDNCMWNWTKDQTQGIKSCFEEDIFEQNEEIEDSQNIPGEYRCRQENFSDAKFSLPGNINFVDMDEQMNLMDDSGMMENVDMMEDYEDEEMMDFEE